MLESLFNKVAGLRLQYRCFPVTFAKFLRAPILKNICKQLPLNIPKNLLEQVTSHLHLKLEFWLCAVTFAIIISRC